VKPPSRVSQQTRPWAAPPPASCAPQTTTARAVVVWSPLAPYDAVGGTDDGLGPTRKSASDPMGTPPPSGKAPTTAPPAPGKAQGSTSARPKADADAQDEPMGHDTPLDGRHLPAPPPPAPHEAVGSGTAGLPWPHTMPWEAQTTASDRYPQVGLGPDGHATAIGKGTYSSPRAPDDAVGSTGAGPKAHSDSQGEPMDTTPPSLAVIFRSPPGPTPGRGHHHRRPPAHLRHPPRGRSSSGLPWTHTMPWEAQTTASALPPSRTMTRWARHHPRERHLQLIPGPRQGHGQDKRRP